MSLDGDVAELRERLQAAEAKLMRLQRLSMLGTVAAMFAHEYNNLITPAVAYAKHAVDSKNESMMQKALTVTIQQTDRLTAMTQRMLGIATAEPASFSSISVLEVVQESLGCIFRDLSRDGITLSLDIDSELSVWSEPCQLQQVLVNLILNARDALLSTKGDLKIRARRTDDPIVAIEVEDTGSGIDPQDLDRIFEPFVTTKDREERNCHGGTGLGLAICRDIVKQLNGTLTVQSVVGMGSTFSLTLPSRPEESIT